MGFTVHLRCHSRLLIRGQVQIRDLSRPLYAAIQQAYNFLKASGGPALRRGGVSLRGGLGRGG